MNWFNQVFTRRHRFPQLSESIREYHKEKVADLMDRGMTREEAERTARREFGNVALTEEHRCEVWQMALAHSLHWCSRRRTESSRVGRSNQRCIANDWADTHAAA